MGEGTKLPRCYISRERLSLHGTTDYGLNAMDGAPFFCVTKAVDPGMQKTLVEEILTYHKHPAQEWAREEFAPQTLTQRAIACECAEWMRRKAKFRSNKTISPMQQFARIQGPSLEAAYMPLHGFTAVDLGHQQGDAVSNIVNRVDETAFTSTYLQLFDQIWSDPTKLEDVTTAICDHIESVYQENSPERISFLMLYNIFSDFLDNIDEDVLPNDRTGYQDTLAWK